MCSQNTTDQEQSPQSQAIEKEKKYIFHVECIYLVHLLNPILLPLWDTGQQQSLSIYMSTYFVYHTVLNPKEVLPH